MTVDDFDEADMHAPAHPLFEHGERLARRRLESGLIGGELLAVLLDLLDAAREQRPVRDVNWQRWARAAHIRPPGVEAS